MKNTRSHETHQGFLFCIKPSKVLKILSGCAFALILLSSIGYYFRFNLTKFLRIADIYIRLFDLNYESNIPTYFSAFILLLAALLLFLISIKSYQHHKPQVKYWLFLGSVFVFLSVDETALIHESVTDTLTILASKQNIGFINNRPGFLTYMWVVPYFILVAATGAYLIKFVWSLPKRIRLLFIISGGIFVSGALGLELVEGHFDALYYYYNRYSSVFYTLEEACEMYGVIIFIYALLCYLSGEQGSIYIYISSEKENSATPAALQPEPGELIS